MPLIWGVLVILNASCNRLSNSALKEAPDYKPVVESTKNLTSAQVVDHFTPPVAARNYAYAALAAYEAIAVFSNQNKSFTGVIKDFSPAFLPSEIPDASMVDLALIYQEAYARVAQKLVYTESVIDSFMRYRRADYQEYLSQEVFQNSVSWADRVADSILAYASYDQYRETRNFPEFVVSESHGDWKPTGPDFLPAIEPHWNRIRPFFLDSASECRIVPPTAYDTSRGSRFRTELEEVIRAVNETDAEKTWIANFWDCNPNISNRMGHVIFFTQKMSPGGHWMHIALQACQAKSFDLYKSAYLTAFLSMGLHDAFIACWDEKYRSNYIRPETVIKDYINPNWEPLLQTPAFPEYPSGHSVVSAAGATILSNLVGEFSFTDSTEQSFNIQPRSFNSFREASDEAAISRLYGGIHYMPAIREGVKMGNAVGEHVLKFKLNGEEL